MFLMKIELIERDTKLTDIEFELLERNPDGDICDDFDMVWIWATKDQKARMTGDDQSRGFSMDEELDSLYHEVIKYYQ